MKAVLLLVFFSSMAFADDSNTVSAEKKDVLQGLLVESYGQEVVDEAKMQEEAEAQIMATLPEKLLECALNADCNDIVAAAKEGGLTQNQIESAMKEIKAEDVQEALNETVQASLVHVYGDGEADTELTESEIMAELPEALSQCRENDSGVDAYIPDLFQSDLCSEVITEVMEAGVSYAMVKGVLGGLTVGEEGDAEKKKPRTVSKP